MKKEVIGDMDNFLDNLKDSNPSDFNEEIVNQALEFC